MARYDAEDIGYMTDPKFWKMIHERRKTEQGLPLAEVIEALEERERRQGASASKKARSTSKTKKR